MHADRLREAAQGSKAFRKLLIEYELFMTAQVQQTAACNAVHGVQSRMCRWLLRMHELVGNDMPLTHEFLSQMIGVRRTSVTGVAADMQRAGMISYTRGRLHIVDIELVRTNANSRISASRCRECSASKWPRHHRAGSPPRQR